LDLQRTKKIHVYDFILERRLLASPADELKLSKLLSDAYKGDSKPLAEEIQFGNETLLGTLLWRTRASSGGHLAQSTEGADRDLYNRSFAWAVPLSSVWPPPLAMGPEAIDNIMWEFELRNRDSEHTTLRTLTEQLEDVYRGAFFTKVSTTNR
jgi:hypothetical protein